MKNFLRLLQNELIKITKQLSYKIIAVIIAAMIILTPLMYYGIEKLGDIGYDYEDDWSYAKDTGDSFLSGKNYYDAAHEYAYYDTWTFRLANELTFEDLNYNLYNNELYSAYEKLELMTFTYKELKNGNFSGLDERTQFALASYYVSLYSENAETDGSEISYPQSGLTLSEAFPYFKAELLTDEVILNMLNEAKTSCDKIKDKILNFSIKEYYEDIADSNEKSAAELETELSEQKELLSAATDAKEKAEHSYNINTYENSLRACEAFSSAISILIEHESEYGGWEYNTYVALNRAVGSISTYVPLEENIYSPEEHNGTSYSEYYKALKEQLDLRWLAADECLCSLENAAPLASSGGAKAGFGFEKCMTEAGSLIVIVLIVIAGTVFSSEFSSGSIRLLLIRPCSRKKICAAKLAAVLVCGFAMMLFAAVAIYAEEGILYGFGSYTAKRVYVFWGKARLIPSFLASLTAMLQDIISYLPYMLEAFFLSVLIGRAPLAISLPLILNFLSDISKLLCYMAYTYNFNLLKYTPLPYVSLSYFRVGPASQFFDADLISTLMNSTADYSYAAESLPWLGAAELLLISAVLVLLSFNHFCKQEIKN